MRSLAWAMPALLGVAISTAWSDERKPAAAPVTCEKKAIDANVTLTTCSDGTRTFSGSGPPPARIAPPQVEAPAPATPARDLPRAIASQCAATSVVAPIPFLGENGEVLALSDGSYWEVRAESRPMESREGVLRLCPSLGMLFVDDKPINVVRLDCHEAQLLEPEAFNAMPGELAALSDGSMWEVRAPPRPLAQAYPAATICPGRGLLLVDSRRLEVGLVP